MAKSTTSINFVVTVQPCCSFSCSLAAALDLQGDGDTFGPADSAQGVGYWFGEVFKGRQGPFGRVTGFRDENDKEA